LRESETKATHAIHGVSERLGILQELFCGALEDSKVPLIVVELRIIRFWKLEEGVVSTTPCRHGALMRMRTFGHADL
jgi:hypothetical protein